jgi:hypothetical protein
MCGTHTTACCPDMSPRPPTGAGFSGADSAFYVTAKKTGSCGANTIAYTIICHMEVCGESSMCVLCVALSRHSVFWQHTGLAIGPHANTVPAAPAPLTHRHHRVATHTHAALHLPAQRGRHQPVPPLLGAHAAGRQQAGVGAGARDDPWTGELLLLAAALGEHGSARHACAV